MNGQAINALAYLMTQIRPEWDPPGCVAALRQLPDVTLVELAIGAIRYAADETNLTPGNLPNFSNRAWDSNWYLPCKAHPNCRARRTNGECAACHADRLAVVEPLPLRRQGTAPTAEQRAAMRGAIGAVPAPAAAPVAHDAERRAQARAELDRRREETA